LGLKPMPLNLPLTIKVEDLEKAHECYDARKLAKYQAMYDGGTAMETVKPDLLPIRPFEDKAGGASSVGYQERLKRAPYSRASAGFIDWLVAAVFFKPPVLVLDENLPEDAQAFYSRRHDNCDGRGTPLAVMMRDAVLECVLHKRCYPTVNFPYSLVHPAEPETMEGFFRLLRACEVQDWQHDTTGRLQWIKWHGEESVRDEKEPWKKPEMVRHVWVFFDGLDATVFEAFKAKGAWKEKEARRISQKAYANGLPVFEVNYRSGQWIMEACFDISQALFIRDSSIEHLADKFAFQILVLNSSRQLDDKIIMNDLAGVRLEPGESISFAAPQGILQPLFDSAEKLRKDLLGSIHASAQNAASIPQAGRLSGDAVDSMREPLHVLLYSFAWPVLDAFNKALALIVKFRGDPEGCARIVGMDEYEATEKELKGAINGKGSDEAGNVSGEAEEVAVGSGGVESDGEGSASGALPGEREGGGYRGGL
jgi:hypothetical protein